MSYLISTIQGQRGGVVFTFKYIVWIKHIAKSKGTCYYFRFPYYKKMSAYAFSQASVRQKDITVYGTSRVCGDIDDIGTFAPGDFYRL